MRSCVNRTPSWQPVVPAWSRQLTPPASRLWASAQATHRPSSTTPLTFALAVNSIIHSKTFDNGMICASEQSVIVVGDAYTTRSRTNLLTAAATSSRRMRLDKVRHTIMINGALNAKIVGQSAFTIAQMAGVTVPEQTKILIGEVEIGGHLGGICSREALSGAGNVPCEGF